MTSRLLRLIGVVSLIALLVTGCETFGPEAFGTNPGNTVKLCGQRWTDAAGGNFNGNPTAISRTWSIAPGDCGNNSLPVSANTVRAVAELLVEAQQAGNFVSCGFNTVTAAGAGNVWATFGNGAAPCDEGCFRARGQHSVTVPGGVVNSPQVLAPEDCIGSA